MPIALTPWVIAQQIKAAAVNLIISAIQEAQTNIAALQVGATKHVDRVLTTAFAGSTWDGVSPLIFAEFTAVSGSWSASVLTGAFPVAFPHGIQSVVITGASAGMPQVIANQANTTLSSWAVSGWSATGTVVSAGTYRVNVHAVGW